MAKIDWSRPLRLKDGRPARLTTIGHARTGMTNFYNRIVEFQSGNDPGWYAVVVDNDGQSVEREQCYIAVENVPEAPKDTLVLRQAVDGWHVTAGPMTKIAAAALIDAAEPFKFYAVPVPTPK